MISVERLLYHIDMKLNKVATNKHQNIPDEDKIIALNECQIKLIKRKISINNPYRLGFDAFRKRYEDLENIVQPHVAIPLKLDVDSPMTRYLAALPKDDPFPNYMMYADAYVIADKGQCTDRVLSCNKVKHSDIHKVMANSNINPSFEYQETPITISNKTVEVYTDGIFVPKTLYLSYIRYPQKINVAGYTDFDGKASTNVDCELQNYLEDELVDLVVQELAMSTENQFATEVSQTRIQNNE